MTISDSQSQSLRSFVSLLCEYSGLVADTKMRGPGWLGDKVRVAGNIKTDNGRKSMQYVPPKRR
jgi:hypothetical protein